MWSIDDGENEPLYQPLGTTILNTSQLQAPTVSFLFTKVPLLVAFIGSLNLRQFQRELCYPPDDYTHQNRIYDSTSMSCDPETKLRLENLIYVDPLHEFTDEELKILRDFKVGLIIFTLPHQIM